MFDAWSYPVALLAQGVMTRKYQRIAVTGLSRGVGVSTFSRALAEALGNAGLRVKLVDTSISTVEETLDKDTLANDYVIIDLPPVYRADGKAVLAWNMATRADILFLLCRHDATDGALLADAVRQFRIAGVTRTEIVLNERDYEPAGQQISRALGRIPVIGQPLAGWLARNHVLG